jgi:16S rRNA G966 N2-methylase RsmD
LAACLKKIPADLAKKTKILKATFPHDLHLLVKEGPFSLLLLDPPYNDPIVNILSFLDWAAATKLATPGATVVWEQTPNSLKLWDQDSLSPWKVLLTRRWGKRAAAILELPANP